MRIHVNETKSRLFLTCRHAQVHALNQNAYTKARTSDEKRGGVEVLRPRVDRTDPGAGVSREQAGQSQAVVAAPGPRHAGHVLLLHVEAIRVVACQLLQQGPRPITAPKQFSLLVNLLK